MGGWTSPSESHPHLPLPGLKGPSSRRGTVPGSKGALPVPASRTGKVLTDGTGVRPSPRGRGQISRRVGEIRFPLPRLPPHPPQGASSSNPQPLRPPWSRGREGSRLRRRRFPVPTPTCPQARQDPSEGPAEGGIFEWLHIWYDILLLGHSDRDVCVSVGLRVDQCGTRRESGVPVFRP